MILRKTDYIVLFLVIANIHRGLSATFIGFRRLHPQDPKTDYIHSRSASAYRGSFLSYSPDIKNGICCDLFLSQLDATSKPPTLGEQTDTTAKPSVTDGETTVDKPQHSLFVGRIIAVGRTSTSTDPTVMEDFFFNCLAKNFQSEDVTTQYTVSSAFRLGFMYASVYQKQEQVEYNLVVKHFIGMSPEYVELEQAKLEEQYVTTRRILRALAQTESAEYIRLIETMDYLSKLSSWQMLQLCNSVISSPVYRKEGLKFPFDWFQRNKNFLRYTKIQLAFENSDYDEEWTAYCIPCRAIDTTSKEMKDLFLVQTYDDKKSIYVFAMKEGLIYLAKYFKRVPILANVNDPITDDHLF